MRVLFFNPEQYVDFENEPSNYELRLPILNCGPVTEWRDFIYQRVLRSEGREAMNRRALQEALAFGPDVVVYSTSWDDESIDASALQQIRANGIPVYVHAWDTHHGQPRPKELEWLQCCDYFGVADSVTNYLRYRRLLPRLGAKGVIFTPGHNVFADLMRKTDTREVYEVTMLGSNEGLRVQLIRFLGEGLSARGVRLHKFGGLVDSTKTPPSEGLRLTDQWVPWDEYVRVINQSRICISSQTVPHRCQIKGKVFDVLACGTLCVSDSNPEIEAVVPSDCIVCYDDFHDCLSKVLYYLEHDDERKRIAEAGHRWFHETFDYRRFWSEFLRAAVNGNAPPPAPADLESAFKQMKRTSRWKTAAIALVGQSPIGWSVVMGPQSILTVLVSALRRLLGQRLYESLRGWSRSLIAAFS